MACRGVLEGASERAETKNELIRDADAAYASFIESGDQKELAGHVQEGIFNGRYTRQAAKQAWNDIWSRDQYAGIRNLGPLRLAMHYTGRQMLMPNTDTIKFWKRQSRFNRLTDVFREMDPQTQHEGRGSYRRFPGRWMDWAVHHAQYQGEFGDMDGSGATISESERQQFRYNNMFWEGNRNMQTQGGGGKWVLAHTPAQWASLRGRYKRLAMKGEQSANLLRDVQQMMYRQRELEGKFSPDLPSIMGGYDYEGSPYAGDPSAKRSGSRRGYYAGLHDPQHLDRAIAEGDKFYSRKARYAGYTGNYYLRPSDQGRGEYAGMMPLYLGQSNTASAPNLQDINAGYMTRQEGTADYQSELTQSDARRYNMTQQLLDQMGADLEAGKPLDPQIKVHLDKLLTDENEFRDETSEELSQTEWDWKERQREFRDVYTGKLKKAGKHLDTHSASYKGPPTFSGGGVREPQEDEHWEGI